MNAELDRDFTFICLFVSGFEATRNEAFLVASSRTYYLFAAHKISLRFCLLCIPIIGPNVQ